MNNEHIEHIPITSTFRTTAENAKLVAQALPTPSMHFPSLAMPRQRTYHETATPVWPTVISRSDSDMVQQDWYFSCNDNSVFLSGYRRYERDAAGNWFIAARWYPDVHALDNLIPIEEVPFPDDVAQESFGKEFVAALPGGGQVCW